MVQQELWWDFSSSPSSPSYLSLIHILRKIKDRQPQANIVCVDYDPGATRINQENRIKLMLANARLQAEKQAAAPAPAVVSAAAERVEDLSLIHI